MVIYLRIQPAGWKTKEALGCLLTKEVEPVFGDNVVICGSKKLVFRKRIGEDFSISKLVYGDLRYYCRHPYKSLVLKHYNKLIYL